MILGVSGWLGYSYYSAANRRLEAKDREIQRLQIANQLLKVDRRVARIDVLSQTGSAKAGDLATKFTFEEIGANNQPLGLPRTFTVRGDLVYVDAWVIKYEDRLVESGDPLRSMSVCLFRRIFGESQEPRDGFVLDSVGSPPAAYRTGETVTDSEREIWSKFWDYANNPALAGQAGIRAAHGEAPSIKLMPGKHYRISLRASGGLEIVTEEAPSRGGDSQSSGPTNRRAGAPNGGNRFALMVLEPSSSPSGETARSQIAPGTLDGTVEAVP